MTLHAIVHSSIESAVLVMSRTHSLFVEEETIDKAKTKKPEDGIFNYGCLHISLGLLICDTEDGQGGG